MIINYIEIGARIRERRKALKLKQNELAEMAELSNNYLSNIENGHSVPSLEALVRLSTALKTTPDFILLGNIRSNNVALNIADNLQLCSEESLEIISDIVASFVKHDNLSKKKI
ncbi:MAG: helix-turn-helix transcriptional regulator [Clostridia bacterium]|nr:helix-turn-helix transcriptional regulator [Clostridia bacterium]